VGSVCGKKKLTKKKGGKQEGKPGRGKRKVILFGRSQTPESGPVRERKKGGGPTRGGEK